MSKGLSSVKTLTAKEIAKKWNLPLAVVSKKIAAGVKVEKEHTKSTRQANEIARDHLGERPDYYDKLHKMEKKKIKIKENTTLTGAIAGLGFNTGVPAVDSDNEYVTTNSLSNDALNGAIMDFVNRHHQHFHDKSGFKHYDAKKLKMSSNKDLAESLGSDYGTAAVPVVGDLTGSSKKVTKIDEVNLKKIVNKIPPNVKKKIKNVAAATALASNALAGASSFQNASTGQGSPVSDAASAAAGLPGKVGYTFFAGKSAKSGFDMAKEHIRSKQKKTERPTNEGKSIVPAQSVERGIYEDAMKNAEDKIKAAFTADKVKDMFKRVDKQRDKDLKWVAYKKRKQQSMKEEQIDEIKAATVGRAVAKAAAERKQLTSKKMGKKEIAKWWKRERLIRAGVNKLTSKSKVPASMEEAWTPFFPPHHKHSARLSKEKANKPDVIMDPGAGGTTKTIHEDGMDYDAVVNAVRSKESRNDYGAKSKSSSASGAYQYINKTWRGSASKYGVDTKEYPTAKSAPKEVQDKVFGNDLMSNAKKYGGFDKAVNVHYTGNPAGKISGAGLKANRGQTGSGYLSDIKKRVDDYNTERKSTMSAAQQMSSNFSGGKNLSTPDNTQMAKTPEPPKTTEPPKQTASLPGDDASSFVKKQLKISEGTKMDTKELINEALDNILDNDLVNMKENFMAALEEKTIEKLEERKKAIAANYFAQ